MSGTQGYYSKLKFLPIKHSNLLKSYLQDRQYVTKHNNETLRCFQIHSGVPQGSNLGPLLYILYTSDLLKSKDTKMGTFADDSHFHPMLTQQQLHETPGTPQHTEFATKMENKSKRIKSLHSILPQERQLPCNRHQSNSPTTGRIRKVLRTILISQTEL
jgi:hypothetical protein